jgi:hypothetical protein
MLSVKEFSQIYEEMRSKDLAGSNVNLANLEQLQTNMIDFLRMKLQEIAIIFKKFDTEGIFEVFNLII